ncbi:hypothetical protein [Roseomonas indoligenes]|uniref:Uncharacterized protein n=1 Tax=Roseomonas indoligenes TaxID=2820811 RepID=A0A940MY52_9PROT|nr:hypothetical protein [Pararoseomonas indoligenes]MBP0493337.1 hypothetical protein [Pararoseomonas indoligenes]
MSPNLSNIAFYVVLLPLVAMVGSIALAVLGLAVAEPWASRRKGKPAPTTRASRGRPPADPDARSLTPKDAATAPVRAAEPA